MAHVAAAPQLCLPTISFIQVSVVNRSIGKHRQSAIDKLNIHETADLTHYAIARDLVEKGVQFMIV
jgi:hypothetical protein